MAEALRPATGAQPTGNYVSQRQHFNYLRNNSCGMYGAFTWNTTEASIQNQRVQQASHHQRQRSAPHQDGIQQGTTEQPNRRGDKRVSFDETNVPRNQQPNKSPQRQNPGLGQAKNKRAGQNQRPASSAQRRSRLQRDVQAEKAKEEQNRQKVQDYIQQIRPYTRTMSNTRYQEYFGKAAPQCYGRANTNQPIGGVIYGNHLKTFNINPHVYTNKPEYYQTHTTAINYGRRAKVCQDKKWKRLEKQLTKKLGLKEKNQTIKQGKQVIYVDVDDSNKYQILKQNHQFQKANKEQIHSRELEYKKEKHLQYLDNINDYYAKKQQKIAENLSTMESKDYSGANLSPEEFEAKLNQQPVYRYHDKDGNVRLAADRHGMTCFVDMNFPENQAAYVNQLNHRMQIFPIKVEGDDQYLDSIRKQNCKKGHQEVYPSHYLLRNCEQPQVIKMLSNKTGVQLKGNKVQNQGRINSRKVGVNSPTQNNNYQNKSFVSTTNTQNQQGQNPNRTYLADERNNQTGHSHNDQRANKSQILDRAWQSPRVADRVLNNSHRGLGGNGQLPSNELEPSNYRNSSAKVGRIPAAG